jgi:hypothetical protein
MREKSIFSGVVRTENSHTELLCNLLHHSHYFQKVFHQFLTGREMPVTDARITTQFVSKDNGRPDLMFRLGSGHGDLIVEVKVRSSCVATAFQTADASEAGYHQLGDVYFLVPRDWDHISTVVGKTRTWEELAIELSRHPAFGDDVILREYLMLLELEFPSIRLTEVERTMLDSHAPATVITTAIKLHRIVDSLADRFKSLGYKVEGESSATEYGYSVRDRAAGNVTTLWFGMWSTYDLLLGAGYMQDMHPAKVYEGFIKMDSSPWYLLSLNELLRSGDNDVVDIAFRRLESTLSQMA